MVYSVTYRRPQHVSLSRPVSVTSTEQVASADNSLYSGKSNVSRGIPDALSFDRIISGGTCPPCTTRDFMNYLLYVELAAENLQFFLWHRDYCRRFEEIPASEKALAPEWTAIQAEAANQAAHAQVPRNENPNTEATTMFKGTDFATGIKTLVVEHHEDTTVTPPRTPNPESTGSLVGDGTPGASDDDSTLKASMQSYNTKAAKVFETTDGKWQPFTIQPFREEVSRIIETYLAKGAPRELNISARERIATIHALRNTTHPSAFRAVAKTVEWSLRQQAHPNFIRWSICNGNRPRVIFARGLGLFGILAGTLAAILITLSHAGRGWRVLAAIGWMIGISTLIAAWKGMCVVLHGMHHRHLRPWELFEDSDSVSTNWDMGKASVETFGTSNSYEDEPWVAKYENRNILRKILDREVWIQEPALRQIQDTIFLQAIGGALVITAICTGIFVALPKGGYY
ncbi:MAG: hypothetical protein M1838_003156 [Thelocarpon superellum]|nr:MAG: hypothetical protein M1838_003156 [Thelocarpon superellum]